jgi:hypothetical protein
MIMARERYLCIIYVDTYVFIYMNPNRKDKASALVDDHGKREVPTDIFFI